MAFPFRAKMRRKMRRNVTQKKKKEEYETKRKRKFQMSWIDEFPSLVHKSDAESIVKFVETMK